MQDSSDNIIVCTSTFSEVYLDNIPDDLPGPTFTAWMRLEGMRRKAFATGASSSRLCLQPGAPLIFWLWISSGHVHDSSDAFSRVPYCLVVDDNRYIPFQFSISMQCPSYCHEVMKTRQVPETGCTSNAPHRWKDFGQSEATRLRKQLGNFIFVLAIVASRFDLYPAFCGLSRGCFRRPCSSYPSFVGAPRLRW